MFLLLFVWLVAPPEIITGKVIGVHDGDTLKILVNQRQTTIRLNAIDAPELGQPFGQKSKQALSSLVFGKTVLVEAKSTDRYGRAVGDARIDGRSVNEHMLREGMAWHFKRYDNNERLAEIEAAARSAKRGLWIDANPEAPWDYRARQQAGKDGADTPPSGGGFVHITATGTKYHSAGCRHLRKSDRVISLEDAIARGLKPCGTCGGKASASKGGNE
jgi:endonuclease YncB( thermonuclease family)